MLTTSNKYDHPQDPLVAILLCTYQGADYLKPQLDSILAQEHKNIALWASDDGSTDASRVILEEYQHLAGEHVFQIRNGPQRGFVANFLSQVCNPEIEADYFAFADQDDIWDPDKISRALDRLGDIPQTRPALYCSRTRLIDEFDRPAGFSPLFKKTPSFANALIQNIGGGNTIVMNQAARRLLSDAGEVEVIAHDWWAYMLVCAAGGLVIYDPHPSVWYRQHGKNIIGSGVQWRDRLQRAKSILNNRSRDWNSTNLTALQAVRHLLTPENLDILDTFCSARKRWLLPRLFAMRKSGVYLQTPFGNLGFLAAIILNKV